MNKIAKMILASLLTFTLLGFFVLSNGGVLATEHEKENLERFIREWQEDGIDSNHTDAIERIRNFVNVNVKQDIFSSLHIDREVQPQGIIVLSFTEEIESEIKQEIESLVEEPAMVTFRVVDYSEKQLIEKQREIDLEIFEHNLLKEEKISVHHTSANIISNKVEIGISPFNEKTENILYSLFGTEMISVVQGIEAQLLIAEATSDMQDIDHAIVPISAIDDDQQKGFIAKIIDIFIGLFK